MPIRNASDEALTKEFEKETAKRQELFLLRKAVLLDLLNNKLCKSSASKGQCYISEYAWTGYGVSLTLHDYDLPTVIDHVAGPFHRQYGVDWILSVPYEGLLQLITDVYIEKQPKLRQRVHVEISIFENDMASCEIRRVIKRTKTQEEIDRALKDAAELHEYELRIDCAGEEEN